MKFLADENFPLASTRLLRIKGYDIATISDNFPGIQDIQVVE